MTLRTIFCVVPRRSVCWGDVPTSEVMFRGFRTDPRRFLAVRTCPRSSSRNPMWCPREMLTDQGVLQGTKMLPQDVAQGRWPRVDQWNWPMKLTTGPVLIEGPNVAPKDQIANKCPFQCAEGQSFQNSVHLSNCAAPPARGVLWWSGVLCKCLTSMKKYPGHEATILYVAGYSDHIKWGRDFLYFNLI